MDTLTLNWNDQNNYTLLSALKDSLTSGVWQIIILTIALIVCFFLSWTRIKESDYFNDEDGNPRFNFDEELFSVGSRTITRGSLVPLSLSALIIIICTITVFTNVSNTHQAGLDREFRTAVSQKFQERGVFISPLDIPTHSEQNRSGQVSRSNAANTGRSCTINNVEPKESLKLGQSYDFTVICGRSTMKF